MRRLQISSGATQLVLESADDLIAIPVAISHDGVSLSSQLSTQIPIVMRLVGTNEEKAHELLEGTDLLMLPTMAEAAQKAVEISHRGEP